MKIKKIKKINNYSNRYDIQVKDTHCFFANNILVHNSLCKVYHDGKKWCTSTNGTAFAEGTTPMGKTYHELFVESLGMDLQDAFKGLHPTFTYIFELTSPENRIVTKYTKTESTLLAARNKFSGCYVDYKVLKRNMNLMSFTTLCESYDITTEEDLKEFVESRDQFDEGCVLYDIGTQMRIKLKSSKYVAIHHLRGNEVTLKSILTLLIKGETSEYLVYFPEDFEMMKPYIDKYNKLRYDIIESYLKYESIENQKEFALTIKDLSYKSFLFGLRKGLNLDDMMCLDKLNHLVKFFEKE